jgi:phage baseplate assembly protein W
MASPSFRFPFAVVDGRAGVVEQDSPAEIAQAVYAVLATERGQRVELPSYGLDDVALLEGGVDPERLLTAVEEWEPRAALLTTESIDDLVQRVKVQVLA